jgi:hypothetical protein
MNNRDVPLFSYGTLRNENVQMADAPVRRAGR